MTTLEEIAELPNNWDNYGAPAFTPEHISAAIALSRKLPLGYEVFPTPRSIQFEYDTFKHYLEIELMEDNTVTGFLYNKKSQSYFPFKDISSLNFVNQIISASAQEKDEY